MDETLRLVQAFQARALPPEVWPETAAARLQCCVAIMRCVVNFVFWQAWLRADHISSEHMPFVARRQDGAYISMPVSALQV